MRCYLAISIYKFAEFQFVIIAVSAVFDIARELLAGKFFHHNIFVTGFERVGNFRDGLLAVRRLLFAFIQAHVFNRLQFFAVSNLEAIR